ncbi:hypothetical protein B0T17DRAFT_506589 [Bombardia bombarda]|uniref:Fibronectin type-III domain-containing protein n=1 Tax=Bombardia bombarda TaxID=252184 RepID=A0AA39XA14_9PEZI|nr:hypothetical protein B0T17DRAFT_506589 [Bombardia bombarda]
MSWTSWTSLVPTLLILSAVLAWWFTEPKNARINLIAAVGVVLFCWAVAPDLSRGLSASLYSAAINALASLRLEIFVVRHANMLLTGAAVVWLVRRAWQTLWKPVPELINILGVDVPDPPDVSLAGIRADAATVNWTRSPASRSVQKFLIQVNGVVVGDVAANQEPAIVVSGLKPNHFYNVRVIAVGSNNFQAGSRVIRLRTFGRDGRPQLGNARLPSNFLVEDPPYGLGQAEYADDGTGAPSRNPVPGLESTTAAPEGVASPGRDGSSAAAGAPGGGPRRNTVTRRHSPSTTSIDQTTRDEISAYSKKTLPELTERFESIRKETEEIASLIAKEDLDSRHLLEELDAEKREKKKEQKKKEEQTEKLRRDVNSTDRSMRNAIQRKGQKEKTLKEKQNERAKFHENIIKWERGIEDMRREQESFDQQTKDLTEERDRKAELFRAENSDLQTDCSRLETELKERREQVKELEEARKKLPGGEEGSEWRLKENELRRNWAQRHRELQDSLIFENKNARKLEEQLRVLTIQVQHIPQTNFNMYSQANTSGLDFDNPTVNQLKRRSRNSNSLSNVSISSPLPAYSQVDPISLAPIGFASSRSANAPPGFAPGPFMFGLSADMPARLDEGGIRAASAPLSPSATALLPSNILDDLDDDDPSPTSRYRPDPFLTTYSGSPDNDPQPQSPASSGPSLSMLSSPHGSSHNLPFPSFPSDASDRRSLHATARMSPPHATEVSTHKLGGLFSFQRSRTAKVMEDEGPPLGSLKQGQSQSFPRQADEAEAEALSNKRRISLSGTWNMFNRNSAGPDIMEGHAGHSRMFSTRSFNPFSSSSRAGGGMYTERDPSSPRPASIASSEFPRPSTDSGSIWGPPSDPTALGKPSSRLWSPDAPWSRNPSRRPSLHGSPSALKTTLASADDEILDEETMPNVHQVGVIGSRPPNSSKPALKHLNPNAPAFIGSLFKSKSEKDRESGREGRKGKEKDKAKDKSKGKDALTPDTSHAPSLDMESPSDSRKSRDGLSVHTQTSVSESRDSLSLDQSFSNTPSEPASAGLSNSAKDENVVRKLFRKSSSSKFGLPGRLSGKESILFKKGPGSTASTGHSDKGGGGGASLEHRSSIGDFEDIGDDAAMSFLGRSYESVTSSPSLAPSSAGAKGKDNKTPVRWLHNFGKKGKKEKESLDLDRAQHGFDAEGGGGGGGGGGVGLGLGEESGGSGMRAV